MVLKRLGDEKKLLLEISSTNDSDNSNRSSSSTNKLPYITLEMAVEQIANVRDIPVTDLQETWKKIINKSFNEIEPPSLKKMSKMKYKEKFATYDYDIHKTIDIDSKFLFYRKGNRFIKLFIINYNYN